MSTPEEREVERLAQIERQFARKQPHELRIIPTGAMTAFRRRLPDDDVRGNESEAGNEPTLFDVIVADFRDGTGHDVELAHRVPRGDR